MDNSCKLLLLISNKICRDILQKSPIVDKILEKDPSIKYEEFNAGIVRNISMLYVGCPNFTIKCLLEKEFEENINSEHELRINRSIVPELTYGVSIRLNYHEKIESVEVFDYLNFKVCDGVPINHFLPNSYKFCVSNDDKQTPIYLFTHVFNSYTIKIKMRNRIIAEPLVGYLHCIGLHGGATPVLNSYMLG